MSKKNKNDKNGFVYSTDPQFKFDPEGEEVQQTLKPGQQKLRVRLETKHRGGKTATVIDGFVGTGDDMETLGKALKNFCGTGGSAKEGEIIIQGDQRDKIMTWLQKNGYTNSKKAG